MVFRDSALFAVSPEGGLVAGLVRWDKAARTIDWINPGGRQRAYEIDELVANTEDRFEFIDHRGRRFVLVPLTPRIYNERIRRPRAPRLRSKAQLLAAFTKSLG